MICLGYLCATYSIVYVDIVDKDDCVSMLLFTNRKIIVPPAVLNLWKCSIYLFNKGIGEIEITKFNNSAKRQIQQVFTCHIYQYQFSIIDIDIVDYDSKSNICSSIQHLKLEVRDAKVEILFFFFNLISN